MNHLFAMVLLLMLVPQNQNLPDAFHQLPEQVSEKATIIVTGTYGEGRGPCIYIGDGRRAWALESWVNVKRVYRGKVGGKSIRGWLPAGRLGRYAREKFLSRKGVLCEKLGF